MSKAKQYRYQKVRDENMNRAGKEKSPDADKWNIPEVGKFEMIGKI